MIVFNCSQAFAEFIEPKKAGPAPLVGKAPSPHPAEDLPFLIGADGQPPRVVQQWLVHLVRVRRKPVVMVMDIETRYAMVFTGLKRGEPAAFIEALVTRLANEMVLAAQSVEMLADFDAMLAQFAVTHDRFQFVRRAERSTQAHLKQALWDFELCCEDMGRLPESHEECARIDAYINDTPRCVKGRKGFFVADVEMLCAWLRAFGGLAPAGEDAVRERWREKTRRRYRAMAEQAD